MEAARTLIATRKTYGFNASIHCSYYAVLQHMKYRLAACKSSPLPYERQKNGQQGGSSHEFILGEVKHRISKPQDARRFTEIVRSLKRCRTEADYTARDFTEAESIECREQAENAINKLDIYFKAV